MLFRVVLTRSAAKELARIPTKFHDKIVEHLRAMEHDPRTVGSEKLTAYEAYKLRVGNYRIVYEINDSEREVRVIMVDDRKQVYKRLKRK